MNIRVLNCILYIRENLKYCDFILIRCSCSEISDNDHSTCIPLSVKWDNPVYGSTCSHDYAVLGQITADN